MDIESLRKQITELKEENARLRDEKSALENEADHLRKLNALLEADRNDWRDLWNSQFSPAINASQRQRWIERYRAEHSQS